MYDRSVSHTTRNTPVLYVYFIVYIGHRGIRGRGVGQWQ